MNKSNISALIKTGLITFLIIILGYDLLALAGKYTIYNTDEISTFASNKNQSYVFYSSGNEGIVLFPWGDYEASVNAMGYFSEMYLNQVSFDDFVDTINLYDNIRYYFYKVIPDDKVDYIYSQDTSLWEIMDYDNIGYNSTYYPSTYTYYYRREIIIANTKYKLEFSYDSSGYIYSFLCNEVTDENIYTEELIASGMDSLTYLLENKSQYINLIINDVIYQENTIDNYQTNQAMYIDYENETYEYKEDVENDYANNIALDETQSWSYQLIKLDTEILLLMSDYGIVFHYNPLNRTITGFNHLSNY